MPQYKMPQNKHQKLHRSNSSNSSSSSSSSSSSISAFSGTGITWWSYWLGWNGIRFLTETWLFFLAKSRLLVEPIKFIFQRIPIATASEGILRHERTAGRLPPPAVKIEKAWKFTSNIPHILIVWYWFTSLYTFRCQHGTHSIWQETRIPF
jgi:hypothetical protein